MASKAKRLRGNVSGTYYVDESCIDCGTCRWIAPASFTAGSGSSLVTQQPSAGVQLLQAQQAQLACPVAAIGSETKQDLATAMASFPLPIDGPVYHCGFHSPKSFGATSYLIKRESGNLMIDSPRYNLPLVRRLESMGGVAQLFLTHIDDVADQARFHKRFGCERIMHQEDMKGSLGEIERPLQGHLPYRLDDEVLIIPVPGHTAGSCCLLYQERYLFTGDHLWWSQRHRSLSASRTYCGHSWQQQIASMERLMTLSFEWVLPGHGRRVQLPGPAMREALERCVEWMQKSR